MDCHNIEEKSMSVIDISNNFSFLDMVDMLSGQPDLVFASNNYLYFIKDDKLKFCKDGDDLTPVCKDVGMSFELLNQQYFICSKKINTVLSSIKQEEVRDFLNKGYTLIYSDTKGKRGWTMWLENESINYSKNNEIELSSEDILNSYISGEWFIIDNSNI